MKGKIKKNLEMHLKIILGLNHQNFLNNEQLKV